MTFADGFGRHCEGRLTVNGVEIEGAVMTEPETGSDLTVCFTPVKGEKPEWMVAKLTELGIDRIVPVRSVRSVVRWDERRAEKLADRFTVTVREACMQSRRARFPIVEPMAPLASLRARPTVVAEPGGRPLTASDSVVAIGPEGGWEPSEIDGFEQVALPGSILRAETAVVVAAAMMASLRSGLLQAADRGSP